MQSLHAVCVWTRKVHIVSTMVECYAIHISKHTITLKFHAPDATVALEMTTVSMHWIRIGTPLVFAALRVVVK